MSESDTTSAAVTRAQSYFLVCEIVTNSLTFAIGPKLLDGGEAPPQDLEEKNEGKGNDEVSASGVEGSRDEENGYNRRPSPEPNNHNNERHFNSEEEADEHTSLIPDFLVSRGAKAEHVSYLVGKKYWDRFPHWAQTLLAFFYAFCHAPLMGAIIGAIIGLAPPLHRAFFNDQQDGGFFNAWLTISVKNVGQLFAALQVVVVGVRLSKSLRRMKRGEESGTVPWRPMVFVFFVRFALWPV